MTMTVDGGPSLKEQAESLFRRKRLLNFGMPAVIVAYFVYIFFSFDIAGLAERASFDNARTLVADSYSYKTLSYLLRARPTAYDVFDPGRHIRVLPRSGGAAPHHVATMQFQR